MSGKLDALYKQSTQAYRQGDVDAAIRYADQLVSSSRGAEAAIVWALRLRLESHRWKDAVEFGTLILRNGPNAAASGMLGMAYAELGQPQESEQCFQAAIQGQGANALWHYHRAAVLIRLRRSFEAMQCLRTAVALEPNPNGLLQLADLELSFGNAAAALANSDRALQMDPSDPAGHTVAARALMNLGRTKEADQRWQQALTPEHTRERITMIRVDAMIEHGEFEGAARSLREVIHQDPDKVLAYARYASAKKIGEDDRPIVAQMERLLSEGNLPDSSRIALGYALGKSYDNLREFETAMLRFDEANRLEYAAIERAGGFNAQGFAANMALRREIFNRGAIEELKTSGDPTEQPIFVLGMIRSGTTLAEQILSAHPMVAGAGEQDHWINADIDLIDYPERRIGEQALREHAGRYLKLLSAFAGDAQRVVDKQPGNLVLAGALHIAFPNARIIHMRRNPADTAVSIWTTQMRTSAPFVHNKANIVIAYREYETLMSHWRDLLPPDRFIEIEYESLITDQERITRQMVEFCGLPWSDDCLYPERNRKQVATPSLWQVRQPLYSSSIGRWRNYEPWLGEFIQLVER